MARTQFLFSDIIEQDSSIQGSLKIILKAFNNNNVARFVLIHVMSVNVQNFFFCQMNGFGFFKFQKI